MRSIVFLVFLCWCGTLCAEDAPTLKIEVYGSDLSAKEFQAAFPNAVVQEQKSDLIGSKQREELFNSVKGLAAHLYRFDELAKDQLYIRATVLPLESLLQAYPEIPQEMLAELRNKVVVTPHPVPSH